MTRLGIIAGGGDLPRVLADNCKAMGRETFVVGLKGFVDDWVEGTRHDMLGMGEIGKIISRLQKEACKDVVFAGNVKRPDFKALKLDMRGMKLLPRVVKAARDGDDALLRIILSEFETAGFRVVGAEEIYQDLLPKPGALGTHVPNDEHLDDIHIAARIAGEIGRLDIGQGAIVCDGLVLAVEAQEGTDAMLKRCATLPEEIRGTDDAPKGVLVKRPKPIQERRIDLPTVGLSTIENAHQAGLAGIAVEAGAALILDSDHVRARADELGLFLYGFTPEDVDR